MNLPLLARYPAPGEIVDGKYRVISILGEGGMGAVAKCDHLLRKVPVALKFMAPHMMAMEGGVERFLNEAVLASQISCDNVVTVFDVGKLQSGAPYLVMEYLEGRDLASIVESEGGLHVPRAIHLVLQILRALQAAHALGVVHRDLKPANAFVVERDGEPDFVKLLDFGISKAVGAASLTATNAALGTPLYMSPEQARNPKTVDARADLYSTGVILYELLSGRTPHISESGEATEVILKLFTEEPPNIGALRVGLPAELCAVVHRALARDREERFADARAMAEALAPFADARSALVLARIRGFETSSAKPLSAELSASSAFAQLPSTPMPSHVVSGSYAPPPMPPRDALAKTQALTTPSPVAQTALSLEADAKPPPRTTPLLLVAVVLVFALGAITIAVIAMRPPPPAEVKGIAAPVDTAPKVVVDVPAVTQSAVVAPPPVTSPSASATLDKPRVVPPPPNTAPTGLGFRPKP